ncbi:MAG: hypothetical protein JO060_02530, partial [Candidatus Eremiobacteraeota bacterium]|nr:hypothetical protein [Candidatus Eremiobacteraeota bacterium]
MRFSFLSDLRGVAATALLAGAIVACLGTGISTSAPEHAQVPSQLRSKTKIEHVVVIVQENRTVDNLFNGFPGANTVRTAPLRHHRTIPLMLRHLAVHCDPGHSYYDFQVEFDHGFGAPTYCGKNYVYSYTMRGDVENYWTLASRYVLADNVFQANRGPSFEAHQYLIAGQSGGIRNGAASSSSAPIAMANNAEPVGVGGCDYDVKVPGIDMRAPYPKTPTHLMWRVPTCQDYETIFGLLDAASPGAINWRYYAPTIHDIWSAPVAVLSHWNAYRAGAPNFVEDEAGRRFTRDVAAGKLAPVTYIVPCRAWSDHPAENVVGTPQGPQWVGYLVNTIGTSRFWNSTAILITWDDWGGWYDHVRPPDAHPNPYANPSDPYEYGFRVPLIIVSPWTKPHFVDHTPRTFTSILAFIETTFGFRQGALGTSDRYYDDLQDDFDYAGIPKPYATVSAPGF